MEEIEILKEKIRLQNYEKHLNLEFNENYKARAESFKILAKESKVQKITNKLNQIEENKRNIEKLTKRINEWSKEYDEKDNMRKAIEFRSLRPQNYEIYKDKMTFMQKLFPDKYLQELMEKLKEMEKVSRPMVTQKQNLEEKQKQLRRELQQVKTTSGKLYIVEGKHKVYNAKTNILKQLIKHKMNIIKRYQIMSEYKQFNINSLAIIKQSIINLKEKKMSLKTEVQELNKNKKEIYKVAYQTMKEKAFQRLEGKYQHFNAMKNQAYNSINYQQSRIDEYHATLHQKEHKQKQWEEKYYHERKKIINSNLDEYAKFNKLHTHDYNKFEDEFSQFRNMVNTKSHATAAEKARIIDAKEKELRQKYHVSLDA
jgi:hypothetical protein